jgi:hypothetical protein
MRNRILHSSADIEQFALTDLQSLYERFQSSEHGLTQDQWQRNFQKFGENRLHIEDGGVGSNTLPA